MGNQKVRKKLIEYTVMAANLTSLLKLELNGGLLLIVMTLICVFHAINQVNIMNIEINFISSQLQIDCALQEALKYVVTVVDMFFHTQQSKFYNCLKCDNFTLNHLCHRKGMHRKHCRNMNLIRRV